MKATKKGNLYRVIVLILVATVLVCAVGFAADGWQNSPAPDSGKTEENNGNTDENKDGGKTGDTPTNKAEEPVIYIPEFTDALTGLETSERLAKTRYLAFVTENTQYLYGMSSASVVFEFPFENGKTRYLVYQNSPENLGKIGALAPSREYMTSVTKSFDALPVTVGSDDPAEVSFESGVATLDLARSDTFAYTENTVFRYTNGDLISAALEASGISLVQTEKNALPYDFYSFGKEPSPSGKSASTVLLPYSASNETELYYQAETGVYSYSKCGNRKIDTLNGKNIVFRNVFLLFADATTYEKADGATTLLDTDTSGSGYYIRDGVMTEFTWKNIDGKMVFTDTDGNRLKVNRGNSYFSFFKSSMKKSVTIQ